MSNRNDPRRQPARIIPTLEQPVEDIKLYHHPDITVGDARLLGTIQARLQLDNTQEGEGPKLTPATIKIGQTPTGDLVFALEAEGDPHGNMHFTMPLGMLATRAVAAIETALIAAGGSAAFRTRHGILAGSPRTKIGKA